MIINSDGTYSLAYSDPTYTAKEHSRILLISGKLGGSTLTVGYLNEFSAFVPFYDTPITLNKRIEVYHGIGVDPVIRAVGSSASTKLSVKVTGVQQPNGSSSSGSGSTSTGVDDKTFIYNRAALGAAASWVVTHNLNKRPDVTLTDENDIAVTGSVKYLDNNTVQIDFNQPYIGKAYFN